VVKSPKNGAAFAAPPTIRKTPSSVLLVVMIIMMIVMVPIAVGMPTSLVGIPPSVVPLPAAFPLRVQVPPALVSLVTAFAVFADSLVNSTFGALNLALAIAMVVVCIQPGDIRHHCPT
jgi:hypothetical protein